MVLRCIRLLSFVFGYCTDGYVIWVGNDVIQKHHMHCRFESSAAIQLMLQLYFVMYLFEFCLFSFWPFFTCVSETFCVKVHCYIFFNYLQYS